LAALLFYRTVFKGFSMSTHAAFVQVPTGWTTSSFGESDGNKWVLMTELGEHVQSCQKAKGKVFQFRCLAHSLHAFFAGRFVTSVVLLGLASCAMGLLSKLF